MEHVAAVKYCENRYKNLTSDIRLINNNQLRFETATLTTLNQNNEIRFAK